MTPSQLMERTVKSGLRPLFPAAQRQRWAAQGMRRSRSLLAVLLAGSFTTPALADPRLWDFAEPKKSKCSEGSMAQMNACLQTERIETEDRLNVVYAHLSRALAQPASLRRSQAAWLRFRTAECTFEVPAWLTGSLQPYAHNACYIDHTERRIRDLERVRPCNGCVEFKPQFYEHGYELPSR